MLKVFLLRGESMENLITCHKPREQVYLVLVPHRDVRVELRKYGENLVINGLSGVYCFPWVVPLALLSSPLITDELKYVARSLRDFLGDEKIMAGEISNVTFQTGNENMELFGARLELDIPNTVFELSASSSHKDTETHKNDSGCKNIKNLISPHIIGSFLIPEINVDMNKDNKQQLCIFAHKINRASGLREKFSIPIPHLSFRAAAVANMFWQPVETNGEMSFKWKIGNLSWLPKKTGSKK